MPLVSVIIPCFNQAIFLAEAVASLQVQSVDDWECIVINDGSTDDTRSVAMSLSGADNRIRYIEQSNAGLSSVRNRGLDLATGDYIQFLDCDDFILPGKFATEIAAAKQVNGPAIVVSDFQFMDEGGRLFENSFCTPEFRLESPLHDLALRWETELSIPIHAFLFDAKIFREGRTRFEVSLGNHEDWDCWMRVFAGDPPIIRVRKKHAVYRRMRNSITGDQMKMWLGFKRAISLQLQRYHSDSEMTRLLLYKEKLTDHSYGMVWRSRLRTRLFDNRFFVKSVPWPIQQFVHRLLAPPPL